MWSQAQTTLFGVCECPRAFESQVAHTLPLMCAPHEHAQHLCHRVLSMACPDFLTVADIKSDVGATRAIGPSQFAQKHLFDDEDMTRW
jgi:hypothetical protein